MTILGFLFVDFLWKGVSSSDFNSSGLEGVPLPNMKSTIKLRLEAKSHPYFATKNVRFFLRQKLKESNGRRCFRLET